MLLCGSANRAKSWSCEHCENWNYQKDRTICLSCYWAYPEDYEHIAMKQMRRIDLLWEGDDVATYEKLKREASRTDQEISALIKKIIEKEVGRNENN